MPLSVLNNHADEDSGQTRASQIGSAPRRRSSGGSRARLPPGQDLARGNVADRARTRSEPGCGLPLFRGLGANSEKIDSACYGVYKLWTRSWYFLFLGSLSHRWFRQALSAAGSATPAQWERLQDHRFPSPCAGRRESSHHPGCHARCVMSACFFQRLLVRKSRLPAAAMCFSVRRSSACVGRLFG